MRDTFETKKRPNTFGNKEGVLYYNIPLRGAKDVSHDPENLDIQQSYYNIIDHSENLGNVFKIMAKEADKGVLLFIVQLGKIGRGLLLLFCL